MCGVYHNFLIMKNAHGTSTVTCPAKLMLITPANPHGAIDPASRAGGPPIVTVGQPGTQAEVTGVQGIGVNTPRAAAVAAATAGFAKLMHTPKGITSAKGIADVILPAGIEHPVVMAIGSTSNEDGAAPIVHAHKALLTTNGIFNSPLITIYFYKLSREMILCKHLRALNQPGIKFQLPSQKHLLYCRA